jgi:hypothetical protein
MKRLAVLGRVLGAVAAIGVPVVAWSASAGTDTSLVGYNAGTLAIGAQFAFNIPGIVPLPNENLIEEDVPFARTNVGGGPVVDALGAPYYPGDIAADLGSLLAEFGAPPLPINDPLLAESKFPTSPGFPAHKTFGILPAAATALLPSIFSSTADSSNSGGDATATLTDLSLDNVSALTAITNGLKQVVGGKSSAPAASLVDVGNISASNSVALKSSAITSTSNSDVTAIDVAGLIDISGLTSTASATSDGTTGTPTASLHLGQVTVDGQQAYIDDTGVHIPSSNPSASGITPKQLQQTVDLTLAQDGVSIRVLDPKLTTNGAAASADAGGLVITISHQLDVPFIPGEPTIPVPALGNVGLPAGVYTATTSISFGLAQANVAASGLVSQILPTSPETTSTGVLGTGSLGLSPSTLGSTGFGSGSVQSLAASGPGSAAGSGVPQAPAPPTTNATAFPIKGVPPPLGWAITGLVACVLFAYPMLLLARWQFVAGRRT